MLFPSYFQKKIQSEGEEKTEPRLFLMHPDNMQGTREVSQGKIVCDTKTLSCYRDSVGFKYHSLILQYCCSLFY